MVRESSQETFDRKFCRRQVNLCCFGEKRVENMRQRGKTQFTHAAHHGSKRGIIPSDLSRTWSRMKRVAHRPSPILGALAFKRAQCVLRHCVGEEG